MGVIRNKKAFLAFLLPGLLFYILAVFYPIEESIRLSFMEWGGIGKKQFVGLENYITMFHDKVFYAALVSLDPSVYEAAKIDGASEMQILFKIKMPLIKDIILLTLTMCLTGALRGFDIPFLLTSGGPGNASELMSTYMYKKAFSSNQYGYGSTLAVFIIIESILVVYILRKIFTSKEQKEEKRIEKERIRRNRRGNH